MGDVTLRFPENTGGNSSFTLEDVDIAWTDGETVAARVSKPSTEAVSTDAALASLTVEGATLSPDFDAAVLVYRAAVDAETVTVTASANDGGAAVTYGPAADADSALVDHQVAVPEGETLVTVTVTAADGNTVRRYRVVVARAAANTAPTGLPAITGTPRVGETLTAGVEDIDDEDGLDDATYAYQWVSNDGDADTDIQGATGASYELSDAEQGDTIKVRVTFTDDADHEETLMSAATVEVAARANRSATGTPSIGGTPRVGETLTAGVEDIDDEDGLDDVAYAYQWVSNEGDADTDIQGATGASYELSDAEQGDTIKVRVTFTDDADHEETLMSAATVEVAARANRSATGTPSIGGTPRVGETLTAGVEDIDDEDGLDDVAYAYQWVSNDGDADTGHPGRDGRELRAERRRAGRYDQGAGHVHGRCGPRGDPHERGHGRSGRAVQPLRHGHPVHRGHAAGGRDAHGRG